MTGWWWNKTEGLDKRYDLQGPVPHQLHKFYNDPLRRRRHLSRYLLITFCLFSHLKPFWTYRRIPSNYRHTRRCWACKDRSEDNGRDHRSIWSSIRCGEACKALELRSCFIFLSYKIVNFIKASLIFITYWVTLHLGREK